MQGRNTGLGSRSSSRSTEYGTLLRRETSPATNAFTRSNTKAGGSAAASSAGSTSGYTGSTSATSGPGNATTGYETDSIQATSFRSLFFTDVS